jgi:N-acylneuraminate cytidylyltransferase/CMP-N,N'-diacetyllegionaminic acid synthase|tara:strand:+ start:2309 stop:2902 length:594 start_codon:yes stop_codon:yes gene_type:complete
MISSKSILAIIPARLGSKRLKYKNIKLFKGRPLFVWSYIAAKKSKYIDKIFISTESKRILNYAKKYGYRSNLLRSKKISKDKTSSEEVILDVLRKNKKFDYFILLQPTSPLRTNFDIDRSINLIISKKKNFLVSINRENKKYNGAIYINKIDKFLKEKKFSNEKKIFFKMSKKKSIDIDRIRDFKQAENYYENNSKT